MEEEGVGRRWRKLAIVDGAHRLGKMKVVLDWRVLDIAVDLGSSPPADRELLHCEEPRRASYHGP